MGNSSLGKAILELAADTATFFADLGKVEKKADGLGATFKKLGSLIAGAFTIGALTSALRGYADLTGQLTDLAAKTGIGVEALQRLKYAAEQNGGSLEQVTGAITKLGANLAGGNKSAVGALDALGLSFQTIRSMAPDQAFTTIADAIAKVPDPMAQSKLAMDLFGKSGAELLPMMKGNLSETAAAAERLGLVMSEDAVRAGDEFGDTMGTLAAVGQSLIAQVLEPMIPVLTTLAQWLGDTLPGAVRFVTDALGIGLGRALLDVTIWINEFLLGVAEGINKIPLLGDKIGFSATTIAGLRTKVDDAKRALTIFTDETIRGSASHEKAAKTIATVNLAYGDTEQAAGKAATAAEKARLASTIWGDGLSAFDHIVGDTNLTLGDNIIVIGDYVTQAHTAADATADLWDQFFRLTGQVRTLGPVLEDRMTRPLVRFAATVSAVSPDAERSFDAIGAAAKNMGTTILGAVQGGGSVTKALGSSFGSALGTDLVTNFGSKITGALGKTLGGALNAMIPGVGALLGPLMGAVGGKLKDLFGIGVNAAVKAANVEISKLRAGLLTTYGPIDQLEAKARAVGLSFQANWGHQGQAGLAAMTALTEEFTRRWDALNEELATTRGELDTVMGQARTLGYEFDATGKLTGVRFEAMQTAAGEYGVTLEALGPAFQNARLQEEAGKIINAFTLLDKGGTDTGTILTGMKDEISKIVGESIKFGTEIPANMQPWIQNLFDTKQLTDENGDALTDISMLKFGAPVATEFEKITTKLDELITKIGEMVDRIATTLTPAIDAATRDRTVRIGWEVDDPPDLSGVGAGLNGVLPMAEGGVGHVTRPTLFLAGERPGGEDYAFSGAGRRFGTAPSGGDGGTMKIQLVLQDGRLLAELATPFIPGELRRLGVIA